MSYVKNETSPEAVFSSGISALVPVLKKYFLFAVLLFHKNDVSIIVMRPDI